MLFLLIVTMTFRPVRANDKNQCLISQEHAYHYLFKRFCKDQHHIYERISLYTLGIEILIVVNPFSFSPEPFKL